MKDGWNLTTIFLQGMVWEQRKKSRRGNRWLHYAVSLLQSKMGKSSIFIFFPGHVWYLFSEDFSLLFCFAVSPSGRDMSTDKN